MGTRALLALTGIMLAGGPATAMAQRSGESVAVTQPASEDLYLAGQNVTVRAPVAGDVVAAGRTIAIDAEVGGDAILAAERVSIDAPVADDVRAVGASVVVGGPVAGHVVAAGNTVVIDRGARVADWAWLAGSEIEVRGAVGTLRAAGERVTIAGEIAGDAEVTAEAIRLAPGAIVRGDLRWSGDRTPVLDGARVEGDIVRVEPADTEPAAARVMGALFWIVSLVVATLLLVLALPIFSANVGQTARVSPWRSIGAGLAVLAGAPVLIALSFLTGVLWIVGALLVAAYVLALIAGAILGVVAAADLIIDVARRGHAPSRRQRALAIVITALAIGALALVPVLGAIVLLVLTVVGAGAACVSLLRMRGRPETTEPLTARPSPA